MNRTRTSLKFVVAIGLGGIAHTAAAQQPIHTDLMPRVIRRAEGERRYLADGRFMLLKVGPMATGANYPSWARRICRRAA